MNSARQSAGPNPSRNLLRPALAVAAVLVVLAVAFDRSHGGGQVGAPPVQLQLLQAERFVVQQPYPHRWRADAPPVQRGWLLVLGGDVAPVRQLQEPVLYVGPQIAERINTGQDSNRLVVLVPGDFGLEDAPIFYGEPALPEEQAQPQIDAALAAAVGAGAVAPDAATIAAAVAEGGAERAPFPTDYELRQHAIDLVERYSPGERDLIAGWRVPRVR